MYTERTRLQNSSHKHTESTPERCSILTLYLTGGLSSTLSNAQNLPDCGVWSSLAPCLFAFRHAQGLHTLPAILKVCLVLVMIYILLWEWEISPSLNPQPGGPSVAICQGANWYSLEGHQGTQISLPRY